MTPAPPSGQQLAEAAALLLGTPFRLHGRAPSTGLDCIGLVHACLLAIGRPAYTPEGYRLRNTNPTRWFKYAAQSGLHMASSKILPGDVVLVQPGPAQQHLVIAETSHCAIHAHAGLRRVVRQRMNLDSDRLAHWRLN